MSSASLGNVPIPVSAFIGRGHEVAEVKRLLEINRLITLTGAGGSGKTRLSLKVVNELTGKFKHGIWFIEFAPVADPSLLPQVAASALGIREKQKRLVTDGLIENLARSHALLVFDNCEHLIAACAELAEKLLQACEGLSILTTSREPLNIAGEVVWTVPPLSLPAVQPWRDPKSGESALAIYREAEAVQLFVERARLVAPQFSLTIDTGAWVAEICRRLDGLPLAIELAAARMRALSVQQIAERLDDRFHLLTSGSRTAPPRQQTLKSTLDWSYSLLSPIEQKVLQRLSVFAGGATLEAAEAVCAGEGVRVEEMLETLSHLVDKSLVTVSQLESGKTRYDLLETIRQYALEKLTGSDEVEDSKIRHLNYFLRWAEGAAPHVDEQGQLAWLADYEADHDNLRAALAWCRAADDKAQAGLRLAAACGRFWRLHGHISEGRTHLSAALAQRGAEKRNAARAWALFRAGVLAYFQSDLPAIHPIAEEALSIWRELGKEGRAGAASTLRLLGELATEEGDYARAPKYFQEAIEIYKDLNDKRGIGDMFLEFGWLFMRLGDMPQAVGYLEEALALGREIGEIHLQLYAYSGLGEAAVRRGQYDRASAMLEQGFALNREMNDRWESGAITGSLGWVALRRGDFKRMRVILRESLSIRVELEDKGGIAWCLEKLAEAAALTGERQKAARIYGAASALRAPLASAIDPADQPDYDRIISSLRSALNVETFAALWAEGESMPLDQVVEYALSEPGPSSASSRAGKEKSGGLTPREREVAALIAQGKSNREIAEQMTVGVRTVETYVTRILAKLGFDSRVQIATWAWEKGLK